MSLADVSGDVTVSFDVKGWTTVEGSIKVTLNGVSQTATYTATVTSPFENKTLSFTGVAAGSTLKIETTAKRAFIDNVSIACGGSTPTPTLTLSASTLTGFTYISGSGPSTSQTYNLSGSDLTPASGNITVTAPTNYEVSKDNSTFSASVTVAYTSSTVSSTAIYVRLKSGLAVASYNSALVTNAGGGATTVNVTCSGSVSAAPTPTLTLSSSTLTGFTYISGSGPSTSQTYNLSGSNLTPASGNITVTAPANYEVSKDNSTYASSVTVAYTSSTLSSTAIYVRLKSGLAVASYNSALVTNAGGGATTLNVTCSGTVSAASTPTLSVSASTLSGFTYVLGDLLSTSQSYNLSASNLTPASGNITVTAPTNFEVSKDNSTYASSVLVTYTSSTLSSTVIYVRLKLGLAIGTYNTELVTNAGGGATTQNVTCSGTVTETSTSLCSTELFISEYLEGSSSNKAIEIFNGTGETITLDGTYRIGLITNGGEWTEANIALTGTIADRDVFVIANTAASAGILALANQTSGSLSHNGDDAVALQKYDGSVWNNIDQIGTNGVDPGTGWAVAGTANSTVDKTLIRKSSVKAGNIDWTKSAGTSVNDCEWVINAADYITNLGSHTIVCETYIKEMKFDNQDLNIYPNPNDGKFTIKLNKENQISEISVVDVTGKVMFKNSKVLNNELNLNLQSGIYFVIVKSDNQYVKKFIIK
jgi:hypothetical protein